MIRKLLVKYKGVIIYGLFGVLTTVVNLITYKFFLPRVGNVAGTVIAWFIAVTFAFITNKLWVFSSKTFVISVLAHELAFFFATRIFTGIIDVGIMYVAVDMFHRNPIVWKTISNMIVIVLNYVSSKMIVFRKK